MRDVSKFPDELDRVLMGGPQIKTEGEDDIDSGWYHVDGDLPENGSYVWASSDGESGHAIKDCQFRNGYFWSMDEDGETAHPTVWMYSNRPDDSPDYSVLQKKYKVKP